jgi:hypothetical protein
MHTDDCIDMIRLHAYPIDAPEGEEYERARVRDCLVVIDRFQQSKDRRHPRGALAAQDETARVFGACFVAVFGEDLVRVLTYK